MSLHEFVATTNRLTELLRAKQPTVVELIGRIALTASEWRQVYDSHDEGDEQPRTHGRWVCELGDRRCSKDPHHFGPHDWEKR